MIFITLGALQIGSDLTSYIVGHATLYQVLLCPNSLLVFKQCNTFNLILSQPAIYPFCPYRGGEVC